MALQTTIQTMAVFFLLLAAGFAAGKIGVIKREFMGQLGQIITNIFLPAMIFYNTATMVTIDLLKDNLILIPLSVVMYLVLALAAFALAKIMRLPHDKDRVFQFAFIFGNTGFVGFPLLNTVFPGTGVLFMCLFSIVDQAAFWTYGVWLATARGRQRERFSPRSIVSPNIVAIVLSLAFAASGLTLPGILDSALGSISHGTTPLCMLFLGAMACFSNLCGAFKRPEAYVGVTIKMVLLPIAAALLLRVVGFSEEVAGCAALYAALPVMTVVPMVVAQHGNEGEYATGIAVVTFIACVATIPLVAWLVL